MAVLLPPEQHRVLKGNGPLSRVLKEVSRHGGYSNNLLYINKSHEINEDFHLHPSEASAISLFRAQRLQFWIESAYLAFLSD